MTLLLVLASAYLAGSLNMAILLTRLAGKEDPRTRFSKNAGATNVYRLLGPAWAGTVLLADGAKAAAVAALTLVALPPSLVPWAGFLLLVGNRFPCFHGLRGGKGIANFIGFCLVVSPWITLAALAGWFAAFRVSGHPFVGSLVLSLILVSGMALDGGRGVTGAAGLLACLALIVWSHRSNIRGWLTKGTDGTGGEG